MTPAGHLCELVDASERLRLAGTPCALCALDRHLRADLVTESAPEAGDDALIAALVDGALARGKGERALRASHRRWLALPAAAGLVLAVAAAAGAALWTGARLARREHGPAAASPAFPLERRLPDLAPPEIPSSDTAPPPRPVRVARAPSLSAARLFAEGNRLRHEGSYQAAAASYRRLQRFAPGSREELTSRVILAQLSLDRLGRPAEALALFDSYLKHEPGGDLVLEAELGRALALRRLARNGEEREAWTNLLQRHPHSAYAAQARRRLAELR